MPTWVEPTPRVSEEVEPLRRSAWLPRTFPDGLKPLPIERVEERPPRTVRDLLPRGAPLERDGTWLMPDTWPHFLNGARGAALMTRDSDALKSVGADAPIFVRTCIKCSKSVDTRCELCSGDAYRKQVDVFCNADQCLFGVLCGLQCVERGRCAARCSGGGRCCKRRHASAHDSKHCSIAPPVRGNWRQAEGR